MDNQLEGFMDNKLEGYLNYTCEGLSNSQKVHLKESLRNSLLNNMQ
jgi:hypothetical protein